MGTTKNRPRNENENEEGSCLADVLSEAYQIKSGELRKVGLVGKWPLTVPNRGSQRCPKQNQTGQLSKNHASQTPSKQMSAGPRSVTS